MTKQLCIDIFIEIWSFVGPRALLLMNRKERERMQKIKEKFIQNPFIIHYRLIRWRGLVDRSGSNHNHPHSHRKSMKLEDEKTIELNGQYKINIRNNKIKFSDELLEEIIPPYKLMVSSIYNREYVLNWNIYSYRYEDKLKGKLYSKIWNFF